MPRRFITTVLIGILLALALPASAAVRYADARAAGNGSGTSWQNAHTTLAAAVAALNKGDTLYTRGDFYEAFAASSLDNVTWIGNSHVRQTRIFGLRAILSTDLTDETGGVFSFALAASPATVTYGYRQDTTGGTVTGIELGGTEIATAFAMAGMDVPEIPGAWYGHLVEETVSPTAPGDGEWGYSAGDVYVNPAGSPTAAQIAEAMRYGVTTSGVALTNCDRWTIRGVYCIAHGAEAEGRGSFYFSGCRFITLEDCVSVDAGYRAFNFAGDTGTDAPVGHILRRCVAMGDSMPNKPSNDTNFPLVFYNGSGSPTSGVRTEDVTILAYPWLGTTGAPTYTGYKFGGLYSHDGGGAATGMGDMEHTRLAILTMSQKLNAKHTLGMLWDTTAAAIPIADAATFTATIPDTYPIRIRRGVIYGEAGNLQNVSLRHVANVIPAPAGSLTNYEGLSKQNWLQVAATSSVYAESCVFSFRRHAETNYGMVLALNGALYMDQCAVGLISTGNAFSTDAIFRHSGTACPLRVRGCVFQRSTEAANAPFIYKAAGNDYDGIDFSSNWFDNFGTSGGSTYWYRNATTDQTLAAWVTAVDSGSDEKYHTDPGFAAITTGDLRLASGSVLEASYHVAPLAALEGLEGLATGTEYSGRYGPWQDFAWGSSSATAASTNPVWSAVLTMDATWIAGSDAIDLEWDEVTITVPTTNTDPVRVRIGGVAPVIWPEGFTITLKNIDLRRIEFLGTASDEVIIVAQD